MALTEYEKAGYDLDYTLAMARVARILRVGEWSEEDGVALYTPIRYSGGLRVPYYPRSG